MNASRRLLRGRFALDSDHYILRLNKSKFEKHSRATRGAMQPLVHRPAVTLNPGNGLFRNDHFQVAYATNDIGRACAVFKERYGIKEYRGLEGALPEGGYIHIELAWVGGIMYELLYSSGAGSDRFTSVLPASGFAIRHHHLGYLVYSQAHWDALQHEIEHGGWKTVSKSDNKGFLQACIIEAPDMGHYLEYIYPEAAGIAFFEGVPSS
jgi:hypothetical protein